MHWHEVFDFLFMLATATTVKIKKAGIALRNINNDRGIKHITHHTQRPVPANPVYSKVLLPAQPEQYIKPRKYDFF